MGCGWVKRCAWWCDRTTAVPSNDGSCHTSTTPTRSCSTWQTDRQPALLLVVVGEEPGADLHGADAHLVAELGSHAPRLVVGGVELNGAVEGLACGLALTEVHEQGTQEKVALCVVVIERDGALDEGLCTGRGAVADAVH